LNYFVSQGITVNRDVLVLDHTSLSGHHYDRCASGAASSHDRWHVLRPEPVEKGGNILHLTSTNQHLRKTKTGIKITSLSGVPTPCVTQDLCIKTTSSLRLNNRIDCVALHRYKSIQK